MKKLILSSLLFVVAFAGQAQACQLTSAKIVGLGVGAGVEKGVCVVTVRLEQITQHRVCPIRSLKIGKEIDVATDLPAKRCPLDEVTLDGVVSYRQGKFRFEGKVR